MPIDLQKLKDFATRLQQMAQQDPQSYAPLLDRTNALIERAVKGNQGVANSPHMPVQAEGAGVNPSFPPLGRVMQVSDYGQPQLPSDAMYQPQGWDPSKMGPQAPQQEPPVAPPSALEDIFGGMGTPSQAEGQWPSRGKGRPGANPTAPPPTPKPWYDFTPLEGDWGPTGNFAPPQQSFSTFNDVAPDPHDKRLPAPNGGIFGDSNTAWEDILNNRSKVGRGQTTENEHQAYGETPEDQRMKGGYKWDPNQEYGGTGGDNTQKPVASGPGVFGVDNDPSMPAAEKGWGWQDFAGLLLGGRNFLQHKAAENKREDYEKRADYRHDEDMAFRREEGADNRRLREASIGVDYQKALDKPEIEEANRAAREKGNILNALSRTMDPKTLREMPEFKAAVAESQAADLRRMQAIADREAKNKKLKTTTEK